ncbi:glycosyltransferase family 4 protein [Bacteroides sp. 519]|uniref:glycosyltransferase family 4 protein n=1 Tax=Bacteroides sp. 519 TaxID=2302937 RepID=UPI0013D2E94F|nr:glycosyltransferase family 4 protein [Bacteroides sp. 519]NDV60293.1 glycosyltransferase [Bacteroides sp. 519]
MRVLFVHDHRFFKKNNLYYSTSGLPKSVWNRYLLDGMNSLSIYAREISSSNKGVVSSYEGVSFNLSQIYKSPLDILFKKRLINEEILANLENTDVAVIRLPSILGLAVIEKCKKLDKPYIIEVVANAFDAYFYYGTLFGKILAPIIHKRLKEVVAESSYVLYVTQYYLQNIYPAAKVIYTVSCSNVFIELFKRKNREDFNKKNTFICGQIGNLSVKFKGYHIMLRSIALLKEKYGIQIYYKIVGAGDSLDLIKIAKKLNILDLIEFVGPLSHEEIFDFLDSLDLYVHPSFQEGLPRAIIEAMSRSCACVASSVAGIPELLDSEYLHEKGNYIKLAEDIYKLYINDDLRFEQGINNYSTSRKYSYNNLEKKRMDFYTKIFNSI